MGSCGGTCVEGTLIPSVLGLLLFLHRGYVVLETTVVASHGNSATTLGEMETTGSRTCMPSSIPAPPRRPNVSTNVSESVNETNKPACPGGIFQTRQSQNVVFESRMVWMVTVQTS